MIVSLYKVSFLVTLLMSTTAIVSATTMESFSLRGGNPAAATFANVSSSHDNSESTHGLFSAVTDTVRKLWVGCSGIAPDNPCNDVGYYPMKCKKMGDRSSRAVFRNKCLANVAGYTTSPNGGVTGFVEGDECKLINGCTYFERGRNTDPVTCNGSTWPDQCVAEKFGKCEF